MADDVKAASAQLAEVEARLGQVKAALKDQGAKKRKLEAQDALRVKRNVSQSLKMCLLFLYIASGLVVDIPVSWLKGQGRHAAFHREESWAGEFKDIVETTYLGQDPNTLAELELSPTDFIKGKVFHHLVNYLFEHNIFHFVLECNLQRGLAPNVALLADNHHRLVPRKIPQEQRDRLLWLLHDGTGNRANWLYRMRQRWGVEPGKLKVAKTIPRTEIYQKLTAFFHLLNWRLQDPPSQPASSSSSPALKPIVCVNLDETAIEYGLGGQVGYVVRRHKAGINMGDAVEPEDTKNRRGTISYIALICDNSLLQPRIPQYLVGNEHRFTAALMREMIPLLPRNIRLVRQKSSWNNASLMRQILYALSIALAGFRIVLLMDCASCHIEATVLAMASRLGIAIALVPAKLTWLVQPLDIVFFLKFKRLLRHLYCKAVLREGTNLLDTKTRLCLVLDAVSQMVCKHPWKRAFVMNGISCMQKQIRKKILLKMGVDTMPEISPMKPSASSLQILLPSNRANVNMNSLLHEWKSEHPSCSPPVSTPVAVAHSSAVLPQETTRTRTGRKLPWLLRPRSCTQMS